MEAMKVQIAVMTVFTGLDFAIILPYLISAASTVAVVAGGMLLLFNLYVVYLTYKQWSNL